MTYSQRLQDMMMKLATGQDAIKLNEHNITNVFLPLARIALEEMAKQWYEGYATSVMDMVQKEGKIASTQEHLITAGLVPEKTEGE